MTKLGTAMITRAALENYRYQDLRGVCEYLNKERPDLDPNWIIQITPPNTNAIDSWIVVYRWEC